MTILSAAKWLATVLEGDATLQGLTNHQQIYMGTAPNTATYPFIQIAFVDGMNVTNAAKDKIMTSQQWLVKAIGTGSSAVAIEPVVERVGVLLHKASGGDVVSCTQEIPYAYEEVDGGYIYQHLGHYYEINVC